MSIPLVWDQSANYKGNWYTRNYSKWYFVRWGVGVLSSSSARPWTGAERIFLKCTSILAQSKKNVSHFPKKYSFGAKGEFGCKIVQKMTFWSKWVIWTQLGLKLLNITAHEFFNPRIFLKVVAWWSTITWQK